MTVTFTTMMDLAGNAGSVPETSASDACAHNSESALSAANTERLVALADHHSVTVEGMPMMSDVEFVDRIRGFLLNH